MSENRIVHRNCNISVADDIRSASGILYRISEICAIYHRLAESYRVRSIRSDVTDDDAVYIGAKNLGLTINRINIKIKPVTIYNIITYKASRHIATCEQISVKAMIADDAIDEFCV